MPNKAQMKQEAAAGLICCEIKLFSWGNSFVLFMCRHRTSVHTPLSFHFYFSTPSSPSFHLCISPLSPFPRSVSSLFPFFFLPPPSLFNAVSHYSSFSLTTILSLSHSLSLWLTEGVQRHQSVCGWGAVCAGERAEAHRRPSSSRGEEAALSHGHRYPKPNYTGKTVLAN